MNMNDWAMLDAVVNKEEKKTVEKISQEQIDKEEQEKYNKFHGLPLDPTKECAETDCDYILVLETIQLILIIGIIVFSWFMSEWDYSYNFPGKTGLTCGIIIGAFFLYNIISKKYFVFRPLNKIKTIQDKQNMKQEIRKENWMLIGCLCNLFAIRLLNIWLLIE